jgi:hypothetical protein
MEKTFVAIKLNVIASVPTEKNARESKKIHYEIIDINTNVRLS